MNEYGKCEHRVTARTPACLDCGEPYENRTQHHRPWLKAYHKYNPLADFKRKIVDTAIQVAREEAEENTDVQS